MTLLVSRIVVEEFWPTFLFGLVCGHTSCTALLRSRHSSSIELRPGPWLGHCNTLILSFFRYSVVDLLVRLGSLSFCPTQFQQSPESCGCETSGNHHPSTTVLVSWFKVLLLICRVWFLPNKALCIMARHLYSGLVCLKDIISEVLRFIQMRPCKPKLCCQILFRKKRLFSWQPVQTSHTCSVFF